MTSAFDPVSDRRVFRRSVEYGNFGRGRGDKWRRECGTSSAISCLSARAKPSSRTPRPGSRSWSRRLWVKSPRHCRPLWAYPVSWNDESEYPGRGPAIIAPWPTYPFRVRRSPGPSISMMAPPFGRLRRRSWRGLSKPTRSMWNPTNSPVNGPSWTRRTLRENPSPA